MKTSTFPLLFGLHELVELFPVAKGTVYRWNTYREGNKQLPDPAYELAGVSVWTEDQVRAFAAGKNLTLDEDKLAAMGKTQRERLAAVKG